jgi:hypothetical protein
MPDYFHWEEWAWGIKPLLASRFSLCMCFPKVNTKPTKQAVMTSFLKGRRNLNINERVFLVFETSFTIRSLFLLTNIKPRTDRLKTDFQLVFWLAVFLR